jgi:hypothetical protein
MRASDALDASVITERLLVGAAPLGPTAVSRLLTMGVTHVLDCRTPRPDPPLTAVTDGLVWGAAPTEDDGMTHGTAWYATCLTFARSALGQDGTHLFCHCGAGVNRGPAAAYAILRWQGWTPEAARTRILTCRPQARPRYFHDADRCLSALGVASEENP